MKCAIDWCTRSAGEGHLMCRRCWARVPRELQRKVYWAWRAYLGSFHVPDPGARERYEEARDAAIAAVGRQDEGAGQAARPL